MKSTTLALTVLLVVAALLVAAQDKRPATFEDIMALESVGTPETAPDGEAVVYTVTAWEETDDDGTTALQLN